jgi:hypothetical protein
MRFGGFFRTHDLWSKPWAVRAYKTGRRVAAAAGFDVVLKTFYSPIPALSELPPGTLERRSDLPGLDFDLDGQLAWIASELAAPMADFQPPDSGPGYTRGTVSYTILDATVLWAVIRSRRPRRVIELGSGASTLVMAQAALANAGDGHPLRLDAYDPFPGVVTDALPGLGSLNRVRAQDVPPATFEELEAGDVLFVDTTHTVKLGSDVNHIVLEVLPRLAPGVLVHVHDIFLPYEYPRQWLEDFGLFWSEQYLVQAFLSGNDDWRVRCATAALARDRSEQLAALLPAGVDSLNGASFWMQRQPSARSTSRQ